MQAFDDVVSLVSYLRSPKGCLWDQQQTLDTIKEKLHEESQEVLNAIDHKDTQNIKEELGDLLWNIIFIADLCEKQKLFTLHDVMTDLHAKIIRRHPHVFGNVKLNTVEEILAHQTKIKKHEKNVMNTGGHHNG